MFIPQYRAGYHTMIIMTLTVTLHVLVLSSLSLSVLYHTGTSRSAQTSNAPVIFRMGGPKTRLERTKELPRNLGRSVSNKYFRQYHLPPLVGLHRPIGLSVFTKSHT